MHDRPAVRVAAGKQQRSPPDRDQGLVHEVFHRIDLTRFSERTNGAFDDIGGKTI
jgi:hypothetical protein